MEQDDRPRVQDRVQRLNGTTLALIGGLILTILVIVFFATRPNADQDKLTDPKIAAEGSTSPDKTCASKATYELIKRELFRRAAQLRGSDQAAYDRLSAVAVLRMENPVMETEDASTGAVNCSGSLALDLPPGVAVVGGRRSLQANVDYTVQPAADGSGNVVLLRNADPVIAPLATLARVEAPPAIATDVADNEEAAEQPQAELAEPDAEAAPAAPPSVARPSFDCADARSPSEIAVCRDNGLAALDVNMAAQYRRALASGSPEQRALLQSTRDRFLRFRDRCRDRQCIGDAYVGRMREIRDIAEGHWQPPR